MNRLISAEVRKLTSTRSTQVTVALALISAPVTTVINTYTAGTNGQPRLDTVEGLHHVLNSAVLVAMVMLGLGVVTMAGEYRHGTVVPTFLGEPRRTRVVVAKVVVMGAVGAVVAGVSFGLAVAAAVPALALHGVHHLPADTAPMLAGAIVEGAVFAVLGVGLGAVTRNTVGAIIGAVVWVAVVEAMVLHAVVPSLARWLPSGTAMALDRTTSDPGALLNPLVAGGVLLAYAVGLAVLGARVVVSRDAV
jgi:ABC-type transport system involved in multi-copper enzyme maturation permease subunit